jgi:hypothetical protein
MMMRMIVAAGIPALTDGLREADEDNPNGYFELEAVKRTRDDAAWLNDARGKVVKLVHVLLKDLPAQHRYRVVMMHRDLDEVIASQQKMLARSGKKGAAMTSEALKRVFSTQLRAIEEWVTAQPNFSQLDVSYNDALRDPSAQARRVAEFLGRPDQAAAMAAAVDPGLYRNRSRLPG